MEDQQTHHVADRAAGAENDSVQETTTAAEQGTDQRETQRGARTWLAEALALAGIIFAAASLAGTRLVENLAVATAGAGGQVAVYQRIIVGDGATAVIGVILAAVALASAGSGTRPWCRYTAVATLIVGVIAVVVSGVTFGLLPQPQPQPPGFG